MSMWKYFFKKYINELLGIKTSVIISSLSNRSRDSGTWSINLKEIYENLKSWEKNTACQILRRWTLLVTSLMRTGASLLERSFLWTQRKLISAIFFLIPLTMTWTGIPVIKPTIFLLLITLTPKQKLRN